MTSRTELAARIARAMRSNLDRWHRGDEPLEDSEPRSRRLWAIADRTVGQTAVLAALRGGSDVDCYAKSDEGRRALGRGEVTRDG